MTATKLVSDMTGLPDEGEFKMVATQGGPVIAMPVAAVRDWHGAYDDEGNNADTGTDYERVTQPQLGKFEVFTVGDSEALSFRTGESTGFWITEEGAIFIQWVAADTDAGLVAAALHPDQKWTRLEAVWRVTASPLALFDSAFDGRRGLNGCWPEPLTVELPPGSYALDEMYWDGDIVVNGENDEVMVRALRLTREV